MFRGQIGAFLNLHVVRQGITQHRTCKIFPKIPSTPIFFTPYRSLQKSSYSKPLVMKKTFTGLIPRIVIGGTCVVGLYELWNNSGNKENGNKFNFVAACAPVPNYDTFFQRHVFGETLDQVLKSSGLELDQKLRDKLGNKYGLRKFNTFLLTDRKDLEERIQKEMDTLVAIDNDEILRVDQWEFEEIDDDEIVSPRFPGGVPGRYPAKYFWLPGEFHVLQCIHHGTGYSYAIGKNFKILVGLIECEFPDSEHVVYRPCHLAGTSKHKYVQERTEEPLPGLPAVQWFRVQGSTMDYINCAIGNLHTFCPNPRPINEMGTEIEKKDLPKPTFAPTPPEKFRKPVPQRHESMEH